MYLGPLPRLQLTFYGAYHDHPINVVIHMIFVPAILWYVRRT